MNGSIDYTPDGVLRNCGHCNGRYRLHIRGNSGGKYVSVCPHCGSTDRFIIDMDALQASSKGDRFSLPDEDLSYNLSRQKEAFDQDHPGQTEHKEQINPIAESDHSENPDSATQEEQEKMAGRYRFTSGKSGSKGSSGGGGFSRRSAGSAGTRSGGRSFWESFFLPSFSFSLSDFEMPGPGKLFLLLGGGAAGLVVFAFLFFYFYIFITSFGNSKYLAGIEPVQPNMIVDRNGKLIAELFSSKTGTLTENELPGSLKEKLLFIEDSSFYYHGAIHWPAIARAVIENLLNMEYSQGASTISQQLARILIDRREKTIFRKLKEASVAYYLEAHLTKDEILAAYMNLVYLGHGSIGFENAADFYFNKKIKELNFTEELVLASLPSAPERYSPLKAPHRLIKKMDAVFERMDADGVASVSRDAYEKQKKDLFRNLNRSPGESVFGNRFDVAPFATEFIRLQLKEILGEDSQFGAGLTIQTTLDLELQKAAMEQSASYMEAISKRFSPVIVDGDRTSRPHTKRNPFLEAYNRVAIGPVLYGYDGPGEESIRLQTASIGLEPSTGQVRFIQGGREFHSGNQLNRAIDMRRQTGSAIKPIIYSAAIESGTITAATPIDDTPFYSPSAKRSKNDPGYWLPDNITGVYEGAVPAREALARSKNIPAIRVAQMVGMDRLKEQFRKFFFMDSKEFQSRFRTDYTIAIGSMEMSPLEMAVAFSAFGNNGTIVRPYVISKILDRDGNVVYDGTGKDQFQMKTPVERKVLPGDVAMIMASMMKGSAARGGTGLYSRELIGKTGTSNEGRDAWFVGVVPGLAAAVWVGYDQPMYAMRNGTGAGVAGPLWGRIISRGKGGNGKGSFSFDPSAVSRTVCEDSGLLPRSSCPRKKSELFTRSNIPTSLCDKHDSTSEQESSTDWSINSDSDFE